MEETWRKSRITNFLAFGSTNQLISMRSVQLLPPGSNDRYPARLSVVQWLDNIPMLIPMPDLPASPPCWFHLSTRPVLCHTIRTKPQWLRDSIAVDLKKGAGKEWSPRVYKF